MNQDVEVTVDTKQFDDLMKKVLGSLGNVEATITNDVFYVPRLEYGYSRQAPKGIVRVSLQEIAKAAEGMVGGIDWK